MVSSGLVDFFRKHYQLNSATKGYDNAPAFVQRMSQWAEATNEITGLVRGGASGRRT
jgi:hypothetical protein